MFSEDLRPRRGRKQGSAEPREQMAEQSSQGDGKHGKAKISRLIQNYEMNGGAS